VGDDVLDLPIMMRVGLAIAVYDANFAVKQRATGVQRCQETRRSTGSLRFYYQAQDVLTKS